MDENKTLSEEQLGDVSGGGPHLVSAPDSESKCYFQTNIALRTVIGENGQRVRQGKCTSICGKCSCHGTGHCVDKWHLLNDITHELEPAGFSNHAHKKVSNNYNT